LRLVLPIIFFLISFSINAQGEANIWYFGNNAGLDFNSSPPTPLSDGQINTPEGCSTLSDANGNLLLYTDGRTVWDREHNIMPNGDYFGGTGLLGDPSSTQSGLIVPHPLEEHLFYVFTVDEPHHENAYAFPNQGPALPDGTPVDNYQDVPSHTVPEDDDGFNNGMNYSIVDMNLRNGLGDIVQGERNNHLVTYNEEDTEEIKYQCSEKITAVAGADCESVWVITHFIDKFYAFKIDENGLDENPVVSTVAPPVTLENYRRASIGYLKASPDGTKLVSATLTSTYNQVGTSDAGDGHVYLYDFDDETGEVSNSLLLIADVAAYGVEFSSNSKLVYASFDQPVGTSIMQWDLEADNIQDSSYSFPGVNLPSAAALQLAPDGKIYISVLGQSRLNVINQPNEVGFAANYTENVSNGAINLGGQTATFGLPPFIQSFFTTIVNILPEESQGLDATGGNNYTLCEGESVIFGHESEVDADYFWYQNDELMQDQDQPFLTIDFETYQNLDEVSFRLEIFPASGECKISGLVNVDFFQIPSFNSVDLVNCFSDEEQSNFIFNLTNVDSILFEEGVNSENYELLFFEDEDFSVEITNPENYEADNNENEVFVLIEEINSLCTTKSKIQLIAGIAENSFAELEACDDFEDGVNMFNLLELENQFENLIPEFYSTESDALSEINPINNPEEFLTSSTTVYARLENSDLCNELLTVDLRLLDLPISTDIETLYYCQEDFPDPIILGTEIDENLSRYEFFWFPDGQTTPTIEVNESGEYEVVVQDIETGCETSKIIEVKESGLTNFELRTSLSSTNNSIEVIIPPNALGAYEFALHNASSFQDSPIFEGLDPGDYRVYVRDKNGCGITARSTTIIGIMKFFTPNADGQNDFWGLRGNRPGVQDRAQISVFDRYGKLLFQFSGADQGWDGTYNGKPMPSNDYWYQVTLEDGQVFKGNFTLKR